MGFLGKWIRFSTPHKHIQTMVTVIVALTAATGIVGMLIGHSAADNFYFHKISRMESVLSMDVAHS